MRRFVTMASLVLFVMTASFWVRSYWQADAIVFGSRVNATLSQSRTRLTSSRGVVGFYHVGREQAQGPMVDMFAEGWMLSSFPAVALRSSVGDVCSDDRWFGFGGRRAVELESAAGPLSSPTSWSRRWTRLQLCVPHGFVALLFAVAPARWIRRRGDRIRRARRALSQCPICGYDLRATPDSCPECGTSAAPDAAAAMAD